jgi:MFS family permease
MKQKIKNFNKHLYYGWIIVLLSALTYFFSSPGQTYSISVFNTIYETELEYTKTMLSTGYSIATTISGFLLVFMGKMIDKYGQRRMLITVSLCLVFATFFSSFVSTIFMIYLSFFILRYFGQGSMTLIPNSLVPQWFEKRRAFAFSMAALGGFLGTFLVPRLNLYLIESFGWQNAWRIWSGSLLFIFLPLVILFLYNKPEDLGISMENQISDLSISDQLDIINLESWNLKEAMKSKVFWFLGIMSMIVPMFTTGVTFHIYSILGERNVDQTSASWIIGFIAFPILIMPLISRVLIDKIKSKMIFIMTQSMILLSMFMLLLWVNNITTALIFILFYGSAVAISSVTLNTVWSNYYGRKYQGSIRGLTTLFMVIGSALGPLPFGISYDQFGSYDYAIYGMIIFGIIGIFLAMLIHKPVKK